MILLIGITLDSLVKGGLLIVAVVLLASLVAGAKEASEIENEIPVESDELNIY